MRNPLEIQPQRFTYGVKGETLDWGIRLWANSALVVGAPVELTEMSWDQWFELVEVAQRRFMEMPDAEYRACIEMVLHPEPGLAGPRNESRT